MSEVATRTMVVHCLKNLYDVYIGRNDPRWQLEEENPWGNPFIIGRDGTREEVVAWHLISLVGGTIPETASKPHMRGRTYAPNYDLLRRLESLRGKRLGCYCKEHDPNELCHGNNYIGLLEGLIPMPELPPLPEPVTPEPVQTQATPAEAPPADGKKKKKGERLKRHEKVAKDIQVYPEQFDGCTPPKQLWSPRRIGEKETEYRGKKEKGVLHLPGRGSQTAEVMFISPCVLEEEAYSSFNSKPSVLRGPAGNLFFRNTRKLGFKDEDWFYTTLCKYVVPKQKLKAEDIRWNETCLEDEIKTIKPKLIVCLGKAPFDWVMQQKIPIKDVQGAFFRSERFDCLVYPMDTVLTPLHRPEYLERFLVDLRTVKRELDATRGIVIPKVATEYTVCRTAEDVRQLMRMLQDRLDQGQLQFLSVDCEWHGRTAWSGRLRSLQIGWGVGKAAYLRFMDDKLNYAMDVPLEEIRQILSPVMNDKRVKFIGHNGAADAVWMENHLDIDTFRRFGFDTMFAQQNLDEYADLKLERLALRHTDLGRYDIDLYLWKRSNKFDEEDNEGYGKVPDDILIPYALRDVDATFRLFSVLMKQIIQQGLYHYFFNIELPFVTDGFVEMMQCGLPMDVPYLEQMRVTFTRNRDLLIEQFREEVKKEANSLLLFQMRKIDPDTANNVFLDMFQMTKDKSPENPVYDAALELFKAFCGAKALPEMLPFFWHWREASAFKINSPDHLKRWLFQVKKYTPLKTTKRDGIQMAWERVLTLPPEKQLLFEPAADKQTIKVLAQKDKLVAQIEELKSVGNIVKAFLKGPDPETGKEQGLQKWIQPDGRIHANFALTETGRPRAWQPNVLNWPKAIAKPIEKGFERINLWLTNKTQKELKAQNLSDEEIAIRVKELITAPVSLRSGVKAIDGWVLIDMDLKTAEVVALGYVSGDDNLIKVTSEPDTQFARISEEDPKKVVRIAYNENEGIPESEWDSALLVREDDPRILRDANGNIVHPKRDLHWEMATGVALKPREKLDERLYRDGTGKVGNFSIPYGASDGLLERMIEVNTGKKAPEGTGKKMIETYERRYPVAARFLKHMEQIVEDPGFYRAISGRLRHFFYNNLEMVDGLSEYARKGILSPLTRQARNFPMQNLVADTTARALVRWTQERRERQMQGRVCMLLYDAVTAMVPLTEAKQAADIIKNCLTIWTPWTVHGRTFTFEVDVSYGFRWGVKATKEEKKLIAEYMK